MLSDTDDSINLPSSVEQDVTTFSPSIMSMNSLSILFSSNNAFSTPRVVIILPTGTIKRISSRSFPSGTLFVLPSSQLFFSSTHENSKNVTKRAVSTFIILLIIIIISKSLFFHATYRDSRCSLQFSIYPMQFSYIPWSFSPSNCKS